MSFSTALLYVVSASLHATVLAAVLVVLSVQCKGKKKPICESPCSDHKDSVKAVGSKKAHQSSISQAAEQATQSARDAASVKNKPKLIEATTQREVPSIKPNDSEAERMSPDNTLKEVPNRMMELELKQDPKRDANYPDEVLR
ncbi:hypothetical protein AAVH_12626 [Aphelenchoides avenae]|nr:hypothetical protein AAVH_12626 [Aphelenchus avenae]